MKKILTDIYIISNFATIIFGVTIISLSVSSVIFWGWSSGPDWYLKLSNILAYSLGGICIISYILCLINSIKQSKLIPTIIYSVVLIVISMYIYSIFFILS